MRRKCRIGVFGGSGFYKFFKSIDEMRIETPYGFPSAPIKFSKVAGVRTAFLPRHGIHHEYPPHMIPYRANICAFKQLGVDRVFGPCAVGSLKAEVRPGDFVFCDQFVNFTSGRKDTFYDGPETTHVSSADPYCPEMRRLGIEVATKLDLPLHDKGTVVVIQGPRFSTRAESKFFRSQRWEVINMTQYPETILSRELAMCYVNISLVTDYDVGLEGDPNVSPVSNEEVIRVFNANISKLRTLMAEMIKRTPEKRSCKCGRSMRGARVSA